MIDADPAPDVLPIKASQFCELVAVQGQLSGSVSEMLPVAPTVDGNALPGGVRVAVQVTVSIAAFVVADPEAFVKTARNRLPLSLADVVNE